MSHLGEQTLTRYLQAVNNKKASKEKKKKSYIEILEMIHHDLIGHYNNNNGKGFQSDILTIFYRVVSDYRATFYVLNVQNENLRDYISGADFCSYSDCFAILNGLLLVIDDNGAIDRARKYWDENYTDQIFGVRNKRIVNRPKITELFVKLDDALRGLHREYDRKANQAEAKKERKYQELRSKLNTAETEEELMVLFYDFQNLGSYKDSAHYVVACEEQLQRLEDAKIENERLDELERTYCKLVIQMSKVEDENGYFELHKEFANLGAYDDASQKALECYQKYENLKAKREKQAQQEKQYHFLLKEMKSAKSENDYHFLAKEFDKLDNFKNSRKFADECRSEQRRLKHIREEENKLAEKYSVLVVKKVKATTEKDYEELIEEFTNLGGLGKGYSKYNNIIQECSKEYKRLKAEREKREEEERQGQLRARYDKLLSEKDNAKTEEDFIKLAEEFDSIADYDNSRSLAKECREKQKRLILERLRREQLQAKYDNLVYEKDEAKTEDDFLNLASEFDELADFSDSSDMAKKCRDRHQELKSEREEREEKERLEKLQAKYTNLVSKKDNAKTEKDFLNLASEFDELADFSDSSDMAKKCRDRHQELKSEREEQERLEGIYQGLLAKKNKAKTEADFLALANEFDELADFSDSSDMAKKCRDRHQELTSEREEQERLEGIYQRLLERKANSGRAELVTLAVEFEELKGYEDSKTLAEECRQEAEALRYKISLAPIIHCLDRYGDKLNKQPIESFITTIETKINQQSKEQILTQLTDQEKDELKRADEGRKLELIAERKWEIVSQSILAKRLFQDNAVDALKDALIPKEYTNDSDLPDIESFVEEALAVLGRIGIRKLEDVAVGMVFTDAMADKDYKKSNKTKQAKTKADHYRIFAIAPPGIMVDGKIMQKPTCSVYIYYDN